MGNIYKQYSNKNFEQKTFSTSQLDLSGLFLSYQFKFSEVSFFHSKTDLNTARDSEENLQVVFYDSEKHSLEQSGLSAKLSFENVSVSLLTANYKTDCRIGQFDNKKQSYLISSFINYEQNNYNLSYETNYQFSEFNHFFLAKFTNDFLTTSWIYRQIPAHSLNWLSSGITNKFNANTRIYAGKWSFCLGKINFSLGSELKSNKKIKHWRSRSFVKLAKDNKVSYQLQQDVYRDYQASQHKKYTHRFACELFSFTNSDIFFSYTVNNKSSSGLANMYQIHYNLSGILGDVRMNFKVLDNYRNEEIVEDINENILATFYDFSQDMLISLRFKSRDYQNVVFIGSLTQSLYNNKLDSFKIELSYHL